MISGGLLLLNKQPGFTSFESLSAVKKAFSTRKVGHTGTLDKFASGLLLVLVGRGVKLARLFADHAKEYTAAVFFGAETDTLDPEGKIIARADIPEREDVEAAIQSFRGDILQSPPAYSAIHIDGRRAHELARSGDAPEMKKRPCTIFELELVSWTPPQAIIRARVSAGTYIRSLARDIALAVESRAHLSALTRTRVGNFRLEDAALSPSADALQGGNFGPSVSWRPLDRNLFNALSLPVFCIDDNAVNGFMNGAPLDRLLSIDEFGATEAQFAGVFSDSDRLLGVVERHNAKWHYSHVFPDN